MCMCLHGLSTGRHVSCIVFFDFMTGQLYCSLKFKLNMQDTSKTVCCTTLHIYKGLENEITTGEGIWLTLTPSIGTSTLTQTILPSVLNDFTVRFCKLKV